MPSVDNVAVTESSGNVFADLEILSPEEALAKAELTRAISLIVEAERLTQAQVADLLGIDQTAVSALLLGHLNTFSIDTLLTYLLALDRDVDIIVKPKSAARPQARVSVV
jgi:predicted XRE-type DNA-binding protein